MCQKSPISSAAIPDAFGRHSISLDDSKTRGARRATGENAAVLAGIAGRAIPFDLSAALQPCVRIYSDAEAIVAYPRLNRRRHCWPQANTPPTSFTPCLFNRCDSMISLRCFKSRQSPHIHWPYWRIRPLSKNFIKHTQFSLARSGSTGFDRARSAAFHMGTYEHGSST